MMMTTSQTASYSSKECILHLSLLDGIGPVTIKKLLAFLPSSFNLAELYTFSVSDCMHTAGLSHSIAQKIVSGLRDKDLLEKELRLLQKHNITFVTIVCERYPAFLFQIYAPPPVLYVRGILPHDWSTSISVIGSRHAHRYAERFIETVVPDLVKEGWLIVSGGAIGADTMAHTAAVRAGGKTVVVLGSGLLHPYPASNKTLFEKVIQADGALVSSFPLETKALPGNFPARNRIIAGLSRGCLVVQAGQKSGTRITAQFALDQGRELFAVPGPVHDPLSSGCHQLIQEGAKLTTCAGDILQELTLGDYAMKSQQKNLLDDISEQKTMSKPESKKKVAPSLHGAEAKIWDACKHGEMSADALAAHVDLSLEEVQGHLFDLQLQGYIKQDFSGLWGQV